MSLHGVFDKSRVFDPTCLYEAKAKPMIQQNCLFYSYIVNYADVDNLSPATNDYHYCIGTKKPSWLNARTVFVVGNSLWITS